MIRRAKGMRIGFRRIDAYALIRRFGLPGNRARRSEAVAPVGAMVGARKPEAQAEGMRIGFPWIDAHSLI